MFTSTSSASSTSLAGWETGATRPTPPSGSLSNGIGEGRGEAAPWQRLDATWPILPESLANGLDGSAQRLVRQCLTAAVGDRLRLLHSLEPESRRIWETRPHLAQYVRQRRFFDTLLPRYGPTEFQRLLYTEVALTVEVLETPPSRLGVEEWAALLDLQCRRIAQLYVQLRERIGAGAQQELERMFTSLPGRQARV